MLLDDYENFTEAQKKLLERYVTNTQGHIFALRNLPEVIKGALFSRYSRSNLGLRSLLLKEFISNSDESGFNEIAGFKEADEAFQVEQAEAIKKAQNFYDRILDGYGDDSIGELGGAHLAIENISMLAAKMIEDSRIGGSPLEKSTRYIYFDQKVNGEYLFYREPVLMTSAFRDLYINTCNQLFDTYSRLIPPLTAMIEKEKPKDAEMSKTAYTAALRAKVLDCLRGLLPSGALTNMGLYGNGRFFEGLIHKLHCSSLSEMQDMGKRIYEELSKVIPSFVRRSALSHHTHKAYERHFHKMKEELEHVSSEHAPLISSSTESGVKLVYSDEEAERKVAAALLYPHVNKGMEELLEYCKKLPKQEIDRILEASVQGREMRRHKSPRALEHAFFTFDIVADFGVYRDLQRHRLLTQEKQKLTCDYGYFVPIEIRNTELEAEYCRSMDQASAAFELIAKEFPEEAQYIVPMAFNIRWHFHVNLRGLQWLTELRSSPAGHPNYRYIAQSMAKQVIEKHPSFERYFRFLDYGGYELGRMGQETKKAEKIGLLQK